MTDRSAPFDIQFRAARPPQSLTLPPLHHYHHQRPPKRRQSRSPSPSEDDDDDDDEAEEDRQPTPPPYQYGRKPLPPPLRAQPIRPPPPTSPTSSGSTRSMTSSPSSTPLCLYLRPGERFVGLTGTDSQSRLIVAECSSSSTATLAPYSVSLSPSHTRIPYVRPLEGGKDWFTVLSPNVLFPDSVGRRWGVPSNRSWLFVDLRTGEAPVVGWGERGGKLVAPGTDVSSLLLKFLPPDQARLPNPLLVRWELPF